jgi:hypothetical protein
LSPVKLALLSLAFVASAGAGELRKLDYTSTSYDEGVVQIAVDSERNASVDWQWDPFRKPVPKTQPRKKTFKVDRSLAEKIFSTLDQIGFSTIQNGRTQHPDEPSVKVTEYKAGKAVHSVTYPASEVPEGLRKMDPLLKSVYDSAKK